MTDDEYFYKLLAETKEKYNGLSYPEIRIEKIDDEKPQPKNKRYNGSWRNYIVDMELETNLKRNFEPINEDTLEIEKTICGTFGCDIELNLIEKLAGNVCTSCMGEKKKTFFNSKL